MKRSQYGQNYYLHHYLSFTKYQGKGRGGEGKVGKLKKAHVYIYVPIYRKQKASKEADQLGPNVDKRFFGGRGSAKGEVQGVTFPGAFSS